MNIQFLLYDLYLFQYHWYLDKNDNALGVNNKRRLTIKKESLLAGKSYVLSVDVSSTSKESENGRVRIN